MALLFTIDASVFVAVCRQAEPGHKDARVLLEALGRTGVPLVEPALVLAEVASALARTGADTAQACDYAEGIAALPGLTVVPLDERLARRVAQTAARHRLRAADAVYAAVAERYGARLVTLDTEQARRAPAFVAACAPAAALKALRQQAG